MRILTTLHQFSHTSKLTNTGSLLRRYSDKKSSPKEEHKRVSRKFEDKCDTCEMCKPCDKCPTPISKIEDEEKLPGCMPFTENVPVPRPQPQFADESMPSDYPIGCNFSKRRESPRCPQSIKLPEHEVCKTSGSCVDMKDSAKKTGE